MLGLLVLGRIGGAELIGRIVRMVFGPGTGLLWAVWGWFSQGYVLCLPMVMLYIAVDFRALRFEAQVNVEIGR